MTKIPVLFRFDKSGAFPEATAVFPTIPAGRYLTTCYAHVGQHGACDRAWCRDKTRSATPDEYASLKAELEREPYKYELRVIKRWPRNL